MQGLRVCATTVMWQKRELQGMTMRAEQLVLENESMRQKQLQDLSDIGADGQPRARKHVNALVDEMNRELNDRVEVLMGENSILIEQVTILQQVRCRQQLMRANDIVCYHPCACGIS